jgi:hypothetical protein
VKDALLSVRRHKNQISLAEIMQLSFRFFKFKYSNIILFFFILGGV